MNLKCPQRVLKGLGARMDSEPPYLPGGRMRVPRYNPRMASEDSFSQSAQNPTIEHESGEALTNALDELQKSEAKPEVCAGTSGESAVTDVSKRYPTRRDLENALLESRESEARLRRILDTIPTL